MKLSTSLFGIASAAILASCAGIPKDMSVAEYCADQRKSFENVCRLKVEIDGNATSLSQTNISLSEARSIADRALGAAGDAQASANSAQAAADRANTLASQAMQRADSAANTMENLTCETRTIQKTNIGTCQPGYTLMSCAQSRFTYRAGGLSILREIDDKQCRFHDRVLEMKVRCCKTIEGTKATPIPVNLRRY